MEWPGAFGDGLRMFPHHTLESPFLPMRPFQMRVTVSSERPRAFGTRPLSESSSSTSETIRQPETSVPLGGTPTMCRISIVTWTWRSRGLSLCSASGSQGKGGMAWQGGRTNRLIWSANWSWSPWSAYRPDLSTGMPPFGRHPQAHVSGCPGGGRQRPGGHPYFEKGF